MNTDMDDRKKAEVVDWQQERQYRAIFELTNDAILIFDYQGRVIEANPSASAMHGYSREEFIGMHGSRFIHPDNHAHFEECLRKVSVGERYSIEGRHVCRDGGSFTVKVTATRFIFAGQPALLTIVRDVTEEQKAVDALRERERHLSAIVENTPECVKIVAADGTLLRINPAGLRMAEAEPSANMTGANAYELVADEHRDMYRAFNERICRGESGILQYDIIGLRGTRRHLETHAVPHLNPDGTIAQLALTRDITEARHAEATLRDSEQRFRAVFHQTAVGMAQADLGGRHVLVNDRYCQITGYNREELLALTFLDITHPDDVDPNRKKFLQLLSEETATYEIEKRYIRKDGSVVWVHVTVSFVRDAEGIPRYTIGAVQDISEQKRKEQALRFLVDLNAAIQPLTEPGEIMTVIARMLGEHLGVDRCAYAEVDTDREYYNIVGDYTRETPSVVGQFSIHAFGEEALRCMFENHTFVSEDVESDPRIDEKGLPGFRQKGIRAAICVPLHKGGRFVAGVAVHQRTPRSWQPDEVELVELVAGRCWESIERARAIRNLQENERRQRFIMDSMPQKIFTAKSNGEDNYFNPQWTEFTGLSVERIQGWGWTQIIHPDDLDENLKTWRHAVDTGEPFQFEHRFRGHDGEYRWHMSRALPMRDAQGGIVMWVGSSTDIHDLRQAKEELVRLTAESERQRRLYETIHDTTPDFVYIFDLNHLFTYANRALLELWGRTAEDALGKNCLELGYPDWQAALHDRELEQVKATKQPIRGEVPFKGTQGRRIYDYIFVPVLNAADDVEAIAGTTRDVTERKQAEESTHRRSEQLRRLADVVTQLNSAHDVTSVMNVVTEEARNLIGTHQAVMSFTVGENWEQAVSTISLSDKYDRWRQYEAKPDGSGIYSQVCRMNRPIRLTQAELEAHPAWRGFGTEAGKHPPMRGWLAVPLVGRDGRNIGLIQLSDKYQGEFSEDDEAILIQMAQMASVAVENARLVEDLREAGRRKDEFLATLAHELRNPLAPLRNMLEVIKRTGGESELLRQAHTMMERQLAHMVRLIDDLLDVSRVSRGKLELRCERVELSSVIAQAVESCRSMIDDAGHELSVDVPSRPVYLNADPVRLEQVFDNLLNNACKYTEPGGRIALMAECRNGAVTVKVKDTGIGIPSDQLGGIFEMFTQVDNSLERLQGGLGIGLTLVRQLVEMHDGTVSAHSDGPGHGSEFVVCLPAADEERTFDERPSTTGKMAPMRPRRILVVDDNRDSAESLAMLLKMNGNQIEVAYDGEAAVEAAGHFQPDLVLLDIGLPKLNGYEACRQIRRRPGGKDMVIVAVSGWGQEQDRLRSQEAGFDRHVVKPVSLEALTELLA